MINVFMVMEGSYILEYAVIFDPASRLLSRLYIISGKYYNAIFIVHLRLLWMFRVSLSAGMLNRVSVSEIAYGVGIYEFQ